MEPLVGTGIDKSYGYETLLNVPESDVRALKASGFWGMTIEDKDDGLCRDRMAVTKSTDPEMPFLDEMVLAVLFLMWQGLPGKMLGHWQLLPSAFEVRDPNGEAPAVSIYKKDGNGGSGSGGKCQGRKDLMPDYRSRAHYNTRSRDESRGSFDSGYTTRTHGIRKDVQTTLCSPRNQQIDTRDVKGGKVTSLSNRYGSDVGILKANGVRELDISTVFPEAFKMDGTWNELAESPTQYLGTVSEKRQLQQRQATVNPGVLSIGGQPGQSAPMEGISRPLTDSRHPFKGISSKQEKSSEAAAIHLGGRNASVSRQTFGIDVTKAFSQLESMRDVSLHSRPRHLIETLMT